MFGYGAIANANSDIPTGVPMSETDFNAIWKTSPNEILYRHCEDCPPSHKDIYMRRTGDTDKNLPFDMLTMVLQDWFEDPKNYLGINFDLYDTYEDALAQTDKWTFCNFDDAGIGFPRDCGKGGKHDGTWNSINRDTGAIYRGGQLNFFFAVETNAILTSDGGAGGGKLPPSFVLPFLTQSYTLYLAQHFSHLLNVLSVFFLHVPLNNQ